MNNHRCATLLLLVFALTLAFRPVFGQDKANYDESKVPDYTLPDLLTTLDGEPVGDSDLWESKRRSEVLNLFKQHMYGEMPPAKEIAAVDQHGPIVSILDGKARLMQVSLYFEAERSGPRFDVCIFLPPIKTNESADRSFPAFLACNFCGNHTISTEPVIRMHEGWAFKKYGRGGRATKWAIEDIVSRGYALVTLCYGDIDPDHNDGFKNRVHALYPSYQDRDDNWGSIGAWAWGLSRVLDYLETLKDIDAKRVAVMGHSRLGKTALWAGATDERFAMVISNNSGSGGAALSRRNNGETAKMVGQIRDGQWFCRKFRTYGDNVDSPPVDQHMLIALAAPRPVYVASGAGNLRADPRGEFLSCVAADPVYKLLGTDGLPKHTFPKVNEPVVGQIGYHARGGKHDVTTYDWRQYLDFADKHLRSK